MKFLKYGLAVVLIAVVALSVAGCSKEPLAAKVNGKKITVAEVDEKLQLQLKQLEQQYGGQHGEMFKGAEGEKIKNQLKQTILDQLIDMELILQEADKQGIKVTDKEVDKKIAEIMKSSNLKDQKALEEALKKTGMTLDKFKGEIDKVIRLEKLISKGLKVTDKDVEKYYNENKALFVTKDQVLAAHILVQKEEDAKRILTEIKGGADFATLAKKYSIDPGSKDNGGKMPWTDKDKFVPEFAEACWKLNPGQISELVKTDYGYHIIKLIDKRPGGQMTFAEAKSEAKEQLLSKMKQDNYSKLIEKLKKKADIKKYLPEEKTTQTPGGVLPGGAPSSQPPAQPGTETGK